MSRYNYVNTNGKRELEHIVVWEEATGEKIPPGYEVHHKDGNGHNNSLLNLQLLSHRDHVRLHAKMRKEGCDVVDHSDPDVSADLEAKRKWRKSNPDKVRESSQRYKYAHPEEVKASLKEWRLENKDHIREYKRKKYAENPEPHKLEVRLYQKAHPEKVREWGRKHRELHHDEELARSRKFRQEHHDQVLSEHRAYNELHRELIAAKAKLAGEKRKTLHYDPEKVKAAEQAVAIAYQNEIDRGIRKA